MTAGGRPTGPRGVFLDATQTYLRAIFELEEERGTAPRRSLLRDRLGIGRASIDQYVQRLSRDGLVEPVAGHRVQLSGRGRRIAARVMRRHRLAERMLVDVVGLDWALAHGEASRWQHVLGEDVERRLVGMLDGRYVSPYGNPIPALDELVPDLPAEASGPRPASVGCDDLAFRGGGTAVVQQLTEGAQADAELLVRLQDAGLRPGAPVEVGAVAGTVTLGATPADGDPVVLEVDRVAASGILVVPIAPDAGAGSDRSSSPVRPGRRSLAAT